MKLLNRYTIVYNDNGNVSVGDNMLFEVNISDQECKLTVIQFVNELSQLRDGYLTISNALTMSHCEVKQILDFVSVTRSSLCVYVVFVFYCLFLCTPYTILTINYMIMIPLICLCSGWLLQGEECYGHSTDERFCQCYIR